MTIIRVTSVSDINRHFRELRQSRQDYSIKSSRFSPEIVPDQKLVVLVAEVGYGDTSRYSGKQDGEDLTFVADNAALATIINNQFWNEQELFIE